MRWHFILPILWREYTSICISLLFLIVIITNWKPLFVSLSVSYMLFVILLSSFYLCVKLSLEICIVINLRLK
nr:MAG TPA: hypothetical protein [Caudoviricetes sp.]